VPARRGKFGRLPYVWSRTALGLTKGQLRLTNQQLEQKTREANEWARKYHELSRQAEASQDRKLAQETKALLQEGKLKEADTRLRGSAITMAQYHAIQTGMGYLEVVRILGRPGVESGRSEDRGVKVVNYLRGRGILTSLRPPV
jgi:hypothetical protein